MLWWTTRSIAAAVVMGSLKICLVHNGRAESEQPHFRHQYAKDDQAAKQA